MAMVTFIRLISVRTCCRVENIYVSTYTHIFGYYRKKKVIHLSVFYILLYYYWYNFYYRFDHFAMEINF
jgi:hypothetical protein